MKAPRNAAMRKRYGSKAGPMKHRLEGGARNEQAELLAEIDDRPVIVFETVRTKPLAQVCAGDIPRVLNAEDVSTDVDS